MFVDSSIHLWWCLLIHFLREEKDNKLLVEFLKASELAAYTKLKMASYSDATSVMRYSDRHQTWELPQP